MAGQHGGYRKPGQSAVVSNPGAGSARTDGGPSDPKRFDLPNARYGEAAAFAEAQGGAPLGPSSSAASAQSAQAAPALPTGLGVPTQMPDQPVTSGANAGPGADASALGIPDSSNEVADLRRRYGPIVPLLVRKAADPRTSDQLRGQIRYLISVIS